MPRRVVAARVRFVRYPVVPPPPPRAADVGSVHGHSSRMPEVAALALDDGAVLADGDGAVVVFSADT